MISLLVRSFRVLIQQFSDCNLFWPGLFLAVKLPSRPTGELPISADGFPQYKTDELSREANGNSNNPLTANNGEWVYKVLYSVFMSNVNPAIYTPIRMFTI